MLCLKGWSVDHQFLGENADVDFEDTWYSQVMVNHTHYHFDVDCFRPWIAKCRKDQVASKERHKVS